MASSLLDGPAGSGSFFKLGFCGTTCMPGFFSCPRQSIAERCCFVRAEVSIFAAFLSTLVADCLRFKLGVDDWLGSCGL